MSLTQQLDNQDYSRAWNKEIKAGHRFYATSPVTGRLVPLEQFRTRRGLIQAKSERTGKWLPVSFEMVSRSA